MHKKTHFAQVPVELVKQIAEEDGTSEQSNHNGSEQLRQAPKKTLQNNPADRAEKDQKTNS